MQDSTFYVLHINLSSLNQKNLGKNVVIKYRKVYMNTFKYEQLDKHQQTFEESLQHNRDPNDQTPKKGSLEELRNSDFKNLSGPMYFRERDCGHVINLVLSNMKAFVNQNTCLAGYKLCFLSLFNHLFTYLLF